METVELNKEDFHMQRAYLFALTIREDVPVKVKVLIQQIEKKLSKLADVKSCFDESPEVDQAETPIKS